MLVCVSPIIGYVVDVTYVVAYEWAPSVGLQVSGVCYCVADYRVGG